MRTPTPLPERYARWQKVVFLGGVLLEESGSVTVADQRWMRVRLGDEESHIPPRPAHVTASDFPSLLAHFYIAWIHPFGDGNGRVARMAEFQLLLEAGLPYPACHLLSNHYHLTREAYYQALDRTSRASGFPVEVIITYAVQGFVDQLSEQWTIIRDHQMEVTWQNHVHELFSEQHTAAPTRQKHIALDLPADKPTGGCRIDGYRSYLRLWT